MVLKMPGISDTVTNNALKEVVNRLSQEEFKFHSLEAVLHDNRWYVTVSPSGGKDERAAAKKDKPSFLTYDRGFFFRYFYLDSGQGYSIFFRDSGNDETMKKLELEERVTDARLAYLDSQTAENLTSCGDAFLEYWGYLLDTALTAARVDVLSLSGDFQSDLSDMYLSRDVKMPEEIRVKVTELRGKMDKINTKFISIIEVYVSFLQEHGVIEKPQS